LHGSFRGQKVIFCAVMFWIAVIGFALKAYLFGVCAVLLGLVAATDSMFPEGYIQWDFFIAWFATGLVIASYVFGFQNARGILGESSPTQVIAMPGPLPRHHLICWNCRSLRRTRRRRWRETNCQLLSSRNEFARVVTG
jgi:hypothetical protein